MPDLLLHLIWRLVASPLSRLNRLEAQGCPRLPAGGCVLCPSHLTILDWAPLMAAIGDRCPRFLVKSSVFVGPVGWFLRHCGAVPVRRGRGDFGALDKLTVLAAAGKTVVVFPEGMLRRGAGPPGARARRGAAWVALAAGVPIIPCALSMNSFRWKVVLGAPMQVAELPDAPLRTASIELTRRLWAEIKRLEDELDTGERTVSLPGAVRTGDAAQERHTRRRTSLSVAS
jgi:1-acyl-sn-glycerol-3-phosphate acyltransferase